MSDHQADYGKHTDEELREGIEKAQQQEPRIEDESSGDALDAERTQHDKMAQELQQRERNQ